MKRIFSFICVFALIFSFCFTTAFATNGGTTNESQGTEIPEIESGAALVMDADTGAILYQKNMTEKLAPADTVQIMTVLLGIESGNQDQTVTVSKETVDGVDREGTHISLTAGEEVKLRDLLYATMLASAADAAKTIAVTVSGTETAFAEAMNARMKQIGAKNTLFTNADGAYSESGYTTAQDMAVLMQEALKNETFRKILGTTSYTMDETNKNSSGRSFTTLCLLMKNSNMDVKYENAIGGKTGWNKKAGYALVSAAKKDGRTLICVILNAETSQQRYEETIALFDYVFNTFRNVEVPTTLLPPTEIPVMKDGTIVRKIAVSIPEGTLLSTNAQFKEGTMTVSSLPTHVSEGDTNIKLTVSAKDSNDNAIVLGTVILNIETKDVALGETPGGEKPVSPSAGAKIWKVVRTILLVILTIIGIIVLLAALLFLFSYLERKKRKALRQKRMEERRREERSEAEQPQYTGRRHRKSNGNDGT